MENKQKEQTAKELNLNDLQKINGGIVSPVEPDDEDHENSNNNGGGATGGW